MSPIARTVTVALAIAAMLAVAVPSAMAAPPGFVGMSADDVFGHGGSYRDKNLKAQRAAGVELLRVNFSWAAMEYAPGSYDFSIYDRYVLDAAKNGIRVLPILFDPPRWRAKRPVSRPTYPPRDPAAMGAWAAMLVDRYGPNGSLWRANPDVPAKPISAWQGWNEPNLKVYWGNKPNAKQYVALLRALSSAIKSRDPNAEIVTAGLPPSLLKGAIRLKPFIKQMYKAGAAKVIDTVAINSYATSDKDLGKLMNEMRKLINRSGGRSDKIWITEVGWCDKGVKSRFCVGSKNQVKYVRGALKLIKRKRTAWKLRGFVYFSWRDGRPYGSGNLWGLHTGLLSVKGKKKPVYNAFVNGVKGL